jgi:DNA polymerase III gamma/tau subunit
MPLAYAPHEKTVAPFFAGLSSGAPPHASLWLGPDGVGKFLWAREAARVGLCLERGESDCRCLSCTHADNHPDFIVLGPAPETLKIESIRAVVHKCTLRPLVAKRRVVIVRDAHRLTVQAQNALLKTLEEPPGQSLFFLVTHREHQLLRTIRSRCHRLRFAPLDEPSLRALFAEGLAKADDASSVLAAAAGSAAQLERLLEAKADEATSNLARLLRAAPAARLAAAEALAVDLETTELATVRFGHQLAVWTREGNPAQRAKAHGLFAALGELLLQAEGHANRRLLWERWLLSVR